MEARDNTVAAQRLINLPRHLLWISVVVGLVTPYVARLPAVPFRGWEWLTAYLSGGVIGFLFSSAFNLIPAAVLFGLGKASKRAPLAFFFALAGLLAFLLWAHGTLNLRSSSTAAIALVFIPIYGIGAVVAAWALGWLVHAVVKNEGGRLWIAGIASLWAIVFGIGATVSESSNIATREARFPVKAVGKISLNTREVYRCCAIGSVEVLASDYFDSKLGNDILVLGTDGIALLNPATYAVQATSSFKQEDCEGCVHMYPSLVPDGKGSFFVATSDGLSDGRGHLLWATKARGFSRTVPIDFGEKGVAFVAYHNNDRIDLHEVDGRVRWSVKLPVETVGLYATGDGQNLPFAIAGYSDSRRLNVYGSDGQLVRTIPLPGWASNVQSIGWPAPGHLLVGGGSWMGVLDPTGKEIFRHVIQGTSFDPYHGPDGTAVKLRESEKPYLAVMSHGSSGYARSVLLVFDPDGQLVWQEEVGKLETLLAMPRSGGEGEALLVGGMNGVTEYSLSEGTAATNDTIDSDEHKDNARGSPTAAR